MIENYCKRSCVKPGIILEDYNFMKKNAKGD